MSHLVSSAKFNAAGALSTSAVSTCVTHVEVECRPGYHNCGDGHCVRERVVCDGYNDCENGTDEQHCDRLATAASQWLVFV